MFCIKLFLEENKEIFWFALSHLYFYVEICWSFQIKGILGFSLRFCQHCAGGIWKHSFKLFVRLCLPFSDTYPSRKQSFSQTLLKPAEFENPGFAFTCGRNVYWIRSFLKTVWFSSNTNPQWPAIVALFSVEEINIQFHVIT